MTKRQCFQKHGRTIKPCAIDVVHETTTGPATNWHAVKNAVDRAPPQYSTQSRVGIVGIGVLNTVHCGMIE